MVRTTYGIVGKDVGISNEKCGIKILSFQQICEATHIIIPYFQRDIQEDKVEQIIQMYKKECKTHQNYFVKHGYTMCLCKIGKKLYLIDGQHRYQALKKVYKEGYMDNILVRIVLCDNIDEMKNDFALLNVNSNIPIVYTYFEDEFVQDLMLKLKAKLKTHYGSCFSRSQSSSSNRMHIDEFMNIFDLNFIKSLYLNNNNVDIFERLCIINNVVQLILSEHNEQELSKYISKNDSSIIKERGFYLSLKNVHWKSHFEDQNKMVEITLLNTQKYKKKNIPKALRNIVVNKHFGNRFISNCFVCYKEFNRDDVQIGHVISEKNGGQTIEQNLRCICKTCNCSMGTQNLNDFKECYFPTSN